MGTLVIFGSERHSILVCRLIFLNFIALVVVLMGERVTLEVKWDV